MSPAICVENLGKCYRLNTAAEQAPYQTLRDSVTRALTAPLRRLRGGDTTRGSSEPFWALKDVGFRVDPGEVVGIIGRNGAGKSTLLKILSRITKPTSGQVSLRGRVGSLLEVGTGFHPELTGRENIFLNGSLLGMTRREIRRRFAEIVEFAEIQKFLDMPVKRYSSGMYVRLAFAVAAHLQTEILLVDEVLAVGDAEFQKKSLGKMTEVAAEGRTVIFVTHQLNSIEKLCARALLLERGQLKSDGRPRDLIMAYLSRAGLTAEWSRSSGASEVENPYFNPARLAVVDETLNVVKGPVEGRSKVGVLLEGEVESLHSSVTIGFAVYSAGGDLMFWSLQTDTAPVEWPQLTRGYNRLVAWLPPHFLNEGEYQVELIVSLHMIRWISEPGANAPVVKFEIRGGLSDSPLWMSRRPGVNAPVLRYHPLPEP